MQIIINRIAIVVDDWRMIRKIKVFSLNAGYPALH